MDMDMNGENMLYEVTNEELLAKVNETRSMLNTI